MDSRLPGKEARTRERFWTTLRLVDREREGERIGELDYIRWDSLAQFWHEYSVVWHNEAESCIETDPGAWIERKIVLRSRRYPDVLIPEFLTAPRTKGVIAVRFASVPVERFIKDNTD